MTLVGLQNPLNLVFKSSQRSDGVPQNADQPWTFCISIEKLGCVSRLTDASWTSTNIHGKWVFTNPLTSCSPSSFVHFTRVAVEVCGDAVPVRFTFASWTVQLQTFNKANPQRLSVSGAEMQQRRRRPGGGAGPRKRLDGNGMLKPHGPQDGPKKKGEPLCVFWCMLGLSLSSDVDFLLPSASAEWSVWGITANCHIKRDLHASCYLSKRDGS